MIDIHSENIPESIVECSTLIDLLRWRAATQPERVAYTFLLDGESQEVRLTYGDLDRQARAIAALLQRHDAYGERVLLLYPAGLDYIAAFFGCLYAGAIAVPAYPPDPARLTRTLPRLQAIASDAQARFALATANLLARLEQILDLAPDLKSLRWLATDVLPVGMQSEWQSPQMRGDSVAFLQYTSGSTSEPRGVLVSHSNLLHNE